jgi:hypothetical protein
MSIFNYEKIQVLNLVSSFNYIITKSKYCSKSKSLFKISF